MIGTSTEAGVIAPSPPASSSPYTEATGEERRRSRALSSAGSSSIKEENHKAVRAGRLAGSRNLSRIRLPLPGRHEKDQQGPGKEPPVFKQQIARVEEFRE